MGAFDNIIEWWSAAQGLPNGQVSDVPAVPPPPLHPYYPLGVEIPGYVENEKPIYVLIASLVGMLASAIVAANIVALKVNPKLTKSNLAVVSWFVLCGCLHCFFEGFFILNHETLASSQHLFAQLWKEYALSDSRYLTSDTFMLSVEAITVFVWGPICFACAVTTVRDSPLRHPLRIIACMAHLYGVALYYSTSLTETYFTGRSDSRPETLYFWVYYVGFNLPWATLPFFIMVNSIKSITRAMRTVERIGITLDDAAAYHAGERAQDLQTKKTE